LVGIIWASLLGIGILFLLLTGNLSVLNESILSNANDALELMLNLLPLIVLWTGILKIADDSGLLNKFAKFLNPILSKLFPSIPKDNKALGYISSNIAANMLGLGSAATPAGLKAMSELQKINEDKETASEGMITFLVLNTAGVTIIPTTILALRVAYGSVNPEEIILPAILATMAASFAGLILDYIIRKRGKKWK
jgi:spore maturation protein A